MSPIIVSANQSPQKDREGQKQHAVDIAERDGVGHRLGGQSERDRYGKDRAGQATPCEPAQERECKAHRADIRRYEQQARKACMPNRAERGQQQRCAGVIQVVRHDQGIVLVVDRLAREESAQRTVHGRKVIRGAMRRKSHHN